MRVDPMQRGKKSETGLLKSIWRGMGHVGVLVSSLFVFGTVMQALDFNHKSRERSVIWLEVYYGPWADWLLFPPLCIGSIIITACCYRAAQNKAIWHLIVAYLVVAGTICTLYNVALIAYRRQPTYYVVAPEGAPFVPQIPKSDAGPTFGELMVPVWMYAVPLAPILLLWSITLRSRSAMSCPFGDPEKTMCLTVQSILDRGRTILLVTHDADDGTWQFMTGGELKLDECLLVPIGEVYVCDRSIGSLADLPLGWKATRSSLEQPWQRSQID
jgi:hypothetical protein